MLLEFKKKLKERESLYNELREKEIEDTPARYNYIQIRVNDDEKLMIKTLAKLSNQTVSEFIRQLVLTQYLKEFLK